MYHWPAQRYRTAVGCLSGRKEGARSPKNRSSHAIPHRGRLLRASRTYNIIYLYLPIIYLGILYNVNPVTMGTRRQNKSSPIRTSTIRIAPAVTNKRFASPYMYNVYIYVSPDYPQDRFRRARVTTYYTYFKHIYIIQSASNTLRRLVIFFYILRIIKGIRVLDKYKILYKYKV